jgi:hypothetical protein
VVRWLSWKGYAVITDAELAIATAWANRQFPDGMRCLVCQKDAFNIDGPLLLPEIENGVIKSAQGIPVVLFTCKHCRHIMLFPGIELGVM